MGLHGVGKSSYMSLRERLSDNRLLDYTWFLEQELNTWGHWVSLPVRRRLWLWKHGFTSPNGKLYDFDTFGPEAYLSDLQRYRLFRSINGNHRYLLDDKLSQHWMLADFPENRPTAYAFVDRGLVHGMAGTAYDGPPVPVADWFPTALRSHSKLVLKQVRGLAGEQVLVCEYDDGFTLDGERVSVETLCGELAQLSSYLVSEYVSQHTYADVLYPDAANTIRILTLWDDQAGDLLVPIAVQRIGTDRSRPVDNVSCGGLTAEIDLETGTLGRAAQKPFSGAVPWYDSHPDTGARIDGTTVPHWNHIITTVERIARQNTNIPVVGWDVMLDESGTPVVIEANTGTDVDLLQVHRPLLDDTSVAAVVSNHLQDVDPPSKSASTTTFATHGEPAWVRTGTAATRNGHEPVERDLDQHEPVERDLDQHEPVERDLDQHDPSERTVSHGGDPDS